MSSKKHQIPDIRFKGFTDAWEQRKLGEVFFQTSKYVNPKESNLELWSLTVEKGLTPKTERYNREFLVKKEDQFKSVDHNEFIYNPMNMTLGALDLNLTGKTVAVSGYYITMLSKVGFDSKYFGIWLKSPLAIKMYKLFATGSLIERQRVQFPTLSQIKTNVPQLEEQIKIGSFFKKLDDTIALHQRQLDNYKELKKSMLQKIFNQELRFKDENGNDYPDWMEIALKELGETFTGLSGKTKENFGKGKGKFVTYMNVFSNPKANLAMTENVEIKDGENQNEVCYGDIFFTTSSETPEEVGMSSVWLSHESNVHLNSFCFGYRLNTESEGKVTHQFLGIQLRAEHIRKKIVLLAQGSTRFNISKAKLIEIPVYLPTIQEQQKITDFLLIVEASIDQTTQKIEWMKEQKKGLMQRMFI